MSKNCSREDLINVFKKICYFSSSYFAGQPIPIEKSDPPAGSYPQQDCLHSSLLGRALTILEIGLTGKQLESAKSMMRESFNRTTRIYIEDYQFCMQSLLNDDTLSFSNSPLLQDIKNILKGNRTEEDAILEK